MTKHALPDGFDDKMRVLASMADRIGRRGLSAEDQSRACAEMSYQLRRMAAFNGPREQR